MKTRKTNKTMARKHPTCPMEATRRVREWLIRRTPWHRADLDRFDGKVTFCDLERRLRGGESFYAITHTSHPSVIGTCVRVLADLFAKPHDFYADLVGANVAGRSGADALVGRIREIAEENSCRLHFNTENGIIYSTWVGT